jgi:hypothetical protein
MKLLLTILIFCVLLTALFIIINTIIENTLPNSNPIKKWWKTRIVGEDPESEEKN